MKRIFFLFLALYLFSLRGFSDTLSPLAKVSLLVCAPGDEIYSYFGHAAIRVYDPLYPKDITFNYGEFSFETPHFIWRFAKGETDYKIGVMRMDSFMQQYKEEKRKVIEYELLLTPEERESIYQALVENYKPANRVYRYSHFEDNCSTRLRDQVEKAVGGNVHYYTTGDKIMSFRNLIDLYLQDNSWSGLGIKLALGMPTDRISTFSQKMFLPDYLGDDLAKAIVVRKGVSSPLAAAPVVIFDAPAVLHNFSFTSPAVVLLLFLMIVTVLTLQEKRRAKKYFWLDVLVFAAFGIAGMILWFTTFVSVMPSAKWNLNLIWAWPTHFIFAILWLFPSLRPKLLWYLKLTAAVLVLFLLTMIVLPQTFHWLVIPLCLMLYMRTGSWLKPWKL
ncbi:MAG TPA: DUF4105 domain-containing protein [Prolixibacteraceae bacterium]